MGIGLIDLMEVKNLLIKKNIPKNFSLCEIGAQQISNEVIRDKKIIIDLAEIFGFNPKVIEDTLGEIIPVEKINGLERLPADAMFSKELWKRFGVRYTAIDIDRSPHSINIDLNYDHCPNNFIGKFDLVTNLGTTEHLANHLNAMNVIHDLTKPGGYIYHNVPTQGYEMHGLINYNPKFFWMLARANHYKFCWMRVTEENESHPLSNDIKEMILKSHPEEKESLNNIRIKDTALIVMMQKINNNPYVPPIDMTEDLMVQNKEFSRRYFNSKVKRYSLLKSVINNFMNKLKNKF